MLPWPATNGKPKRASVNSFGYGGANAHCILEELDPSIQGRNYHVNSIRSIDEVSQWVFDDPDSHAEDSHTTRPYTLVLSANDATSLKDNITALCQHSVNPRVRLSIRDLAYTLTQRRSHLWHRAFVTMKGNDGDGSRNEIIEFRAADFTIAKKQPRSPSVGFVFTGQGAQWPQMGRDLLRVFPSTTRAILEELDGVLQGLTACEPPRWSILEELTEPRAAEHLRQPEFSQPLATALQLCLLAILEKWGIKPSSVVGHSSGEIAAAYAAGLLSRADAIKAAFFRGRAIVSYREKSEAPQLRMLAVGMSRDAIAPFLEVFGGRTSIACFNSPNSVTVSGPKDDLEVMERDIKSAGHFARLLRVDMAYHSPYMGVIGSEYEALLTLDGIQWREPHDSCSPGAAMFSSVTASKIDATIPTNTQYWTSNLLSPVRFDEAVRQLLSDADHKSPDILIEVGPSGALAGPISQILKSLSKDVSYHTAWSRGADAIKTLFDVAGRLFITGVAVDLRAVNTADLEDEEDVPAPRCIVDLPSYRWNHSAKYWYESQASKDWRFRRFITHDLIGSKILGTPWTSPSWHKRLQLEDVPWLRHHKMDGDVLMPATAFCAMALEAMYQKHSTLELDGFSSPHVGLLGVNDLGYGLRNVRFINALVLEEDHAVDIYVTLARLPRSSADSGWHVFRIFTSKDNASVDHCTGLIRVQDTIGERLAENDPRREPLQYPQVFSNWYKTQREVGMDFGASFQKVKQLEAVSGQRSCRALVDLTAPPSKWDPQSKYSLHPATLDACLHTLMAPNACNERSLVKETQVPGVTDECFINPIPLGVREGLVLSQSRYSGRGRLDQAKGLLGNVSVYDAASGAMLMGLKNLHYATLDAPLRLDQHVFDAVKWQPDITCLAQDQVETLWLHTTASSDEQNPRRSRLQAVIDLIAHKRPQSKILELSLDDTNVEGVSLWLADTKMAAREACLQYDFACTSAEKLVAVQRKYQTVGQKIKYHLANLNRHALGLDFTSAPQYDLAIVQVSPNMENSKVRRACEELEILIANDGLALVAQIGKAVEDLPPRFIASVASSAPVPEDSQLDRGTTLDLGITKILPQSASKKSASFLTSVTGDQPESFKTFQLTAPHDIRNFDQFLTIHDGPLSHCLAKMRGGTGVEGSLQSGNSSMADTLRHLAVVVPHLSSPFQGPEVQTRLLNQIPSLFEAIAKSPGSPWSQARTRGKLTCTLLPVSDAVSIAAHQASDTIIMVLDELFASVLATPSSAQWTTIQTLLASGCDVLWLTAGAAAEYPERAMAHGLLRVVRREFAIQDQASRVVLDIDTEQLSPSNGPPLALARAVAQVLCLMKGEGRRVEPEYRLGRDGVLSIPRLVPDAQVNEFRRLSGATTPVIAGLGATRSTVRLRGDRVGTLNVTWCECGEEPLQEGCVEVEVEAVGVNFKVTSALSLRTAC